MGRAGITTGDNAGRIGGDDAILSVFLSVPTAVGMPVP
jgi:hypothetical protein